MQWGAARLRTPLRWSAVRPYTIVPSLKACTCSYRVEKRSSCWLVKPVMWFTRIPLWKSLDISILILDKVSKILTQFCFHQTCGWLGMKKILLKYFSAIVWRADLGAPHQGPCGPWKPNFNWLASDAWKTEFQNDNLNLKTWKFLSIFAYMPYSVRPAQIPCT